MPRGKRKTAVIAVTGAKGGIAKTSTAVSVAVSLVRNKGRKVLVLGIDPQGSCSLHLGFEYQFDRFTKETEKKGTFEFCKGVHPKECIHPIEEGLYLMPSDRRLEDLVVEMNVAEATRNKGEKSPLSFGVPLTQLAGSNFFDVIIIDCPPRLSDVITEEAWLACDGLIFPVVPSDSESSKNLKEAFIAYKEMKRSAGYVPDVIGVLQAKVDLRSGFAKRMFPAIRKVYSESDNYIGHVQHDVKMFEAVAAKKHIFDYAPYSKGAIAYTAVADRVDKWVAKFQLDYNKAVAEVEDEVMRKAEKQAEVAHG